MSTIKDRDGTQSSKTEFNNSKDKSLALEKEVLEKNRAKPTLKHEPRPDGNISKAVHTEIEYKRECRIKEIDKSISKQGECKTVKRQFNRSERTR